MNPVGIIERNTCRRTETCPAQGYAVKGMDGVQEELLLDRYRPLSEIGAGSFGTVQLAWDTRIQRRVAIKCLPLSESSQSYAQSSNHQPFSETEYGQYDPLHSGYEQQEQGVDQVAYDAATTPGLDEARTAAMLNDTNIVGVLDFEVRNAMAYLIMEYVDGMTLGELLRTHRRDLSLDMIAAIFEGVAHALDVAHENRVLHLDIKPDNILINHQGVVKVSDFGLSRLSGRAGFGHAGGGTIGYMPPEQMRMQPLDGRCDEWALASMTYEMISGDNPFFAPDLPRAEAAIDDAEIVLPSLCMEGLDANADDVLFYALDPDREERYDTVRDFSEELLPYLGDPAEGRRQLAELIGTDDEVPEPSNQHAPRRSFSFPSSIYLKGWVFRVWNAVNCGMLGFVALSNATGMIDVGSPLFAAALVAVIAVAAALPSIGFLAAIALLCLALAIHAAWIPCAVLAIAAVTWWVKVGRVSAVNVDVAASPVLLGAIGGAQMSPLLCGYFLSARKAAATACFAGVLALILAAFGSMSLIDWNMFTYWQHMNTSYQDRFLALLGTPATWWTVISWVIAAALTGLFCQRGKRRSGLIGVCVGGVTLIALLSAQTWIMSSMTSTMIDTSRLIQTIVPIVVMVALSFAVEPGTELAHDDKETHKVA